MRCTYLCVRLGNWTVAVSRSCNGVVLVSRSLALLHCRHAKASTPAFYRLHKPFGQAVVTIRGKDHYLGKFDCPESHQRFRQLVAESLTCGTVEVRRRQVADAGPTVDELTAAFWRALEQSGRYRKDGKPTSDWSGSSNRSVR